MSDEEKKAAEDAEQQTEQVEETKDEVSEEVIEQMDAFDKKADEDDGEEETSAEDDTDSSDDDGSAEKKPAEKAEDDDTGKEKPADETQQTAEEKEIAEAADALAAKADADAGKTAEQKQADVDAAKQAEEAKVVAEAKAKEADKYVSDLDPEEWDEATIQLDTQRGQNSLDSQKALLAKNDELEREVRIQANQRTIDWMDRKFESLGEDFHEVLGDGDWDDLDPGSDQDVNRQKVGERMHFIGQAYLQKGKAVPNRTALLKRAVSDLFPKIVNKTKIEKETAGKLTDRRGQVLGKGSKKASITSKADKALKANLDFDKLADE